MLKVKDNEQKSNQNLVTIENTFDRLSQTTDNLDIKAQLSLLLSSLENIIIMLSFDINDVNDAILFSKILHPTVLSPAQLY